MKRSPVSEYLADIGRRGGQKKGVAKGFAALSPEERKAASEKGVKARRKAKAKK